MNFLNISFGGVMTENRTAAVFIDSRSVVPGSTFIAIKGEYQDGHSYIADALRNGATHIIAEHVSDDAASTAITIVADSLAEFQRLAKRYLSQLKLRKIAITGSSGKTTTKSIVAKALEILVGEEKVLATAGTQNNHLGVPLTAFRAREEHKFGVFELGMNHAGEISVLTDIVQPDIALITNIGSTHSANFSDPNGVMNAKAEIYNSLAADGVAIIYSDSPKCVRAAEGFSGKKFSFGEHSNADLVVSQIYSDLTGTRFTLKYAGECVSGNIPLLGAHNALNAAASAAVLLALGFGLAEIVEAMASVTASYRRLEKHVLPNQAVILDDCYNANPESVAASIEILKSSGAAHKIAVLGDMLELASPESRHEEIGRLCGEAQFHKLYFCGAFAQDYARGAHQAGFPVENTITAETSELLAKYFNAPRAGDIILVKGSRGMKMEIIVEHLQALS